MDVSSFAACRGVFVHAGGRGNGGESLDQVVNKEAGPVLIGAKEPGRAEKKGEINYEYPYCSDRTYQSGSL